MTNTAELFDVYYYDHCCGSKVERNDEWLGFFDRIAGRIVTDLDPASVLDAGCALGFLVESLRKRGVEAFGIDVSGHAIKRVHEGVRDFCRVASVTEPLPRRYDLIVTIEVLEHLPARDADITIANLCEHTDRVLFSSSPLDYAEVTHFNVQPPEYWAGLFARHGFYRNMDLDAAFVTPWAVYYERQSLAAWQLTSGYERLLWQRTQIADAQRKVNIEQRNALARAEQLAAGRSEPAGAHTAPGTTISQAESELATLQKWRADVEGTLGWAVLTRLQRLRAILAPPGSVQNSWLDSITRSVVRREQQR